MVKCIRALQISSVLDPYSRAQDTLKKPAGTVGRSLAMSNRRIVVMDDDNPSFAREMEVPEHMARSQRREQQVLRVRLRGITSEHWIV